MSAQLDEPISVVVVVFNPGHELDDLAASLPAASSRPVQLVLVNNGAVNETIERVVASTGATVVDAGGNVGYGAGVNRGIAASRGPWVVAANPDIIMSPGSLDDLLLVAEEHPEAGALGPCLLNSDGSVYPSARSVPRPVQGAMHALLAGVWKNNPWSRAYRRERTVGTGQTRPTGWLSGAFLLLRRSAFESVGGFDESFFMFFEDLDLGERLSAAGWQNLYVPSVQLTHVQGVSWKARPALMISAHHRSALTYVCKRYPAWYHLPLRVAARIALRVRETVQLRAAARG